MSGLAASVVWLVKPEGKEREEVMGVGRTPWVRKTPKPAVQKQSSGSQLLFHRPVQLVLRE